MNGQLLIWGCRRCDVGGWDGLALRRGKQTGQRKGSCHRKSGVVARNTQGDAGEAEKAPERQHLYGAGRHIGADVEGDEAMTSGGRRTELARAPD